jgi:hypothetical protein
MSRDVPLGFGDYLKAAFWRRIPVRGLGPMPVNQLALAAFAVLGLANPGFWLLGAAAELAYLFGLSGNRRFQNLIQAERRLQGQEEAQVRLQQAINGLSPESQRRYSWLLSQAREIAEPALRLDDAGGPVKLQEVRSGGLSQLVWIFLRLLLSRESVEKTLQRVDGEHVELEILQLEEKLASLTEESPLQRSIRGTLEIQQKRLENLHKAEESRRIIDAELERIERQVELIREEAALSNRPEVLSDRLDSVSVTLNETNRWMEQHSEIFGGLSGLETDPLAADPLVVDPIEAPVPEPPQESKR